MSIEISAFNAVDFNSKRWINQQLLTPPGDSVKESTVSALSLKLALHASDINTTLEETLSQAIVRLPRIMLEVGRMAIEAQQLRESVNSLLQSEAAHATHKSHDRGSMAKLYEIKCKLEVCKLTLQQATFLTQNIAKLDELFRTASPDEISQEISKMQTALKALEGYEIQAKFQQSIVDSEQRLQGMIETQCVEQMISRNTAKAKSYFALLAKIGRSAGVVSKYITHATGSLMKQWDSVSATRNAAVWIETNTTVTVSLLKREQIEILELFGEDGGMDVTAKMTAHVLGIVAVAIEAKIQELSLPDVVQCYASATPLLIHCASVAYDLAMKPFAKTWRTYAAEEQSYLSSQLKNLSWIAKLDDDATQVPLQISPSLLTAVHESCSHLFVLMETAAQRCLSLTAGMQWVPFLKAINNVTALFVSDVQRLGKYIQQAAESAMSASGIDNTIIKVVFQLQLTCVGLQTRQIAFDGLVKKLILQHKERTLKSFHYKHLADTQRASLDALLRSADVADVHVVDMREVSNLTTTTATIVLRVLCLPIDRRLRDLSGGSMWTSQAPKGTSGFAPSEYVRAIGDILIELPMLLESQNGLARSHEAEDMGITYWLEAVLDRTVEGYCTTVSALTPISPSGAEQLGTDIEYVDNVLSAITDRKFVVLMDFYNVATAPLETIDSVELASGPTYKMALANLVSSRKRGSTEGNIKKN